MFRKYEKTYRIQTPNVHVAGKKILSKTEQKDLITGRITIEEKIDGANVGVIASKKGDQFRLQKRGSLVEFSEHPQFQRFKAWTMERYNDLMKLPYPYVLYGEFMWATHHIFYDSLPDWFICFDIWNGKKFLKRSEVEEICCDLGIEVVPLLFEGYVDNILDIESYLRGPSAFSSEHDREGIVVKNNRKQMKGKLVVPEFVKEINEDGIHWMTKWDSRKVNQLKQ